MSGPPTQVGKSALLVIDMQHDFVDLQAPTYAVGAEGIIEPISGVIAAARLARIPVIFTREAHRADFNDTGREGDPGIGALYPGGTQKSATPDHCVEGTHGFSIISELLPQQGEVVIDKRRYSCFLGTDLDMVLRSYSVETLIVAGVCTDICVLWTVGEAWQRDYHVRVLEDCVAGTTKETHAGALSIMRRLTVGTADGFTSQKVIAAWEPALSSMVPLVEQIEGA